MDIPASQYGSGGESGWTVYLDQSSLSKDQCYDFGGLVNDDYGAKGAKIDVEEEEDLSMVSDASSAPRYYCQSSEDCFDENGWYCSSASPSESAKKSKKKSKIKGNGKNQQHSCLDDTASSPLLGFSKKNYCLSQNEPSMEHVLDFSQGLSATHLKVSTFSKLKLLSYNIYGYHFLVTTSLCIHSSFRENLYSTSTWVSCSPPLLQNQPQKNKVVCREEGGSNKD